MKKTTILLLMLTALTACGRPSADRGRTLIQNQGSDTLVNVAQAWAESYKEIDPDVAVSGGGSGTGVSALINGTVDIANSSRKLKDKEFEMARKNGVELRPLNPEFETLVLDPEDDLAVLAEVIEVLR